MGSYGKEKEKSNPTLSWQFFQHLKTLTMCLPILSFPRKTFLSAHHLLPVRQVLCVHTSMCPWSPCGTPCVLITVYFSLGLYSWVCQVMTLPHLFFHPRCSSDERLLQAGPGDGCIKRIKTWCQPDRKLLASRVTLTIHTKRTLNSNRQ